MTRERRTIPIMRDLSAAARDCPMAPPEHATVYARAIHRACLVLGGMQQLARRLDVSTKDVERWLRGEETPPEKVFLEAVEVILLQLGAEGRPN
jgi:ribosome-binding protein aMBF1 (putative translation factor)